MLFNCNYNVNDLRITSQFYLELLKWWSEFREENAIYGKWHYIIWNNRDIRIDRKPFFYKKYYWNKKRSLVKNIKNMSFRLSVYSL